MSPYFLAQADDPILDVPTDGAGLLVWLLVAGIIGGLYVIVQRTRQRADDEYWERKRRERGGDDLG